MGAAAIRTALVALLGGVTLLPASGCSQVQSSRQVRYGRAGFTCVVRCAMVVRRCRGQAAPGWAVLCGVVLRRCRGKAASSWVVRCDVVEECNMVWCLAAAVVCAERMGLLLMWSGGPAGTNGAREGAVKLGEAAQFSCMI
jgi:hypothetical protein